MPLITLIADMGSRSTRGSSRASRRKPKKASGGGIVLVLSSLAMTAGTVALITWIASKDIEIVINGDVQPAAADDRVEPAQEATAPPSPETRLRAENDQEFTPQPPPDETNPRPRSIFNLESIDPSRLPRPEIDKSPVPPNPRRTTVDPPESELPEDPLETPRPSTEVEPADRPSFLLIGDARRLKPAAVNPLNDEPGPALRALLQTGSAKAAAEAAIDRFNLVRTDPHPYHVAAVSFHLAGNSDRATQFAERALSCWHLVDEMIPVEGILNVAALYLEENPSRGIKLLAEQLEKRMAVLDVADEARAEAQRISDALGICIGRAEREGTWTPFQEAMLLKKIDWDRQLGRSSNSLRFGESELMAVEADSMWDELFASRDAWIASRKVHDQAQRSVENRRQQLASAEAYKRRWPKTSNTPVFRVAAALREAEAAERRSGSQLEAAERRYLQAEKPRWPGSLPLYVPIRYIPTPTD